MSKPNFMIIQPNSCQDVSFKTMNINLVISLWIRPLVTMTVSVKCHAAIYPMVFRPCTKQTDFHIQGPHYQPGKKKNNLIRITQAQYILLKLQNQILMKSPFKRQGHKIIKYCRAYLIHHTLLLHTFPSKYAINQTAQTNCHAVSPGANYILHQIFKNCKAENYF